jgi:predicted TIM-barrel enzyme
LAGLMPYKDANAVVLDMASEVLPVRLYTLCSFVGRFYSSI